MTIFNQKYIQHQVLLLSVWIIFTFDDVIMTNVSLFVPKTCVCIILLISESPEVLHVNMSWSITVAVFWILEAPLQRDYVILGISEGDQSTISLILALSYFSHWMRLLFIYHCIMIYVFVILCQYQYSSLQCCYSVHIKVNVKKKDCDLILLTSHSIKSFSRKKISRYTVRHDTALTNGTIVFTGTPHARDELTCSSFVVGEKQRRQWKSC